MSLTTQEAALFLNVSEPFLVQLLEGRQIPFHTANGQCKIPLKDLTTYKERAKAKGRKLRKELTQEAQNLGLGY